MHDHGLSLSQCLTEKGNVPGAKEFSCQQILLGIYMTFHYIKALNRLQEAGPTNKLQKVWNICCC